MSLSVPFFFFLLQAGGEVDAFFPVFPLLSFFFFLPQAAAGKSAAMPSFLSFLHPPPPSPLRGRCSESKTFPPPHQVFLLLSPKGAARCVLTSDSFYYHFFPLSFIFRLSLILILFFPQAFLFPFPVPQDDRNRRAE